MESDRIEAERARVIRDPKKPAYDNPVGDKGELAAGNNIKKPRPKPRKEAPEGHPSDRVLGRKPPR